MRKILIQSIDGGEVLAKDVLSTTGKLVMAQGMELKPEHTEMFRSFGVTNVYIKEPELTADVIEKVQEECCERVCDVIEAYSHCGNDNLSELVVIAEQIMKEILTQPQVVYRVSEMETESWSTYSHSINVCALSILVALRLKLPEDRVHDMAVGALLHDIGYVYLPKDYETKKYETCTPCEQRELKKHVINGYTVVEDEEWLSQTARDVILSHHEYCDGSGFPLHYSQEKLRKEVRIVSICNEFDSRIHGYHHEKEKAYDVIEYIMGESGRKFNLQTVRVFLASVAVYPTGTYVLTDKNEVAEVVEQNQSAPLRPILSMKRDREGKPYENEVIVDMLEELSVKIVDTISASAPESTGME